ncbi:MAG: hypothetical protein WHV26_13175 [Spirochaetota bacterium]
MRVSFYTCILILLCGVISTTSYAEVVQVSQVRLEGLKYVAQHEILHHGIFMKEGKIFVDVSALHAGLSKNIMIESFKVNIEKHICTIQVIEKVILAVILFDRGDSLVSVEVDSNLSILSTSRVYAYDRPIIKISQAEVINNKLSPRIIHILIILKNMIQNNSAIVSRISVINCTDPEVSYVQFHGFTSQCIWDETYSGLSLLDAVIGVCDSKKAYPDNAMVTQKRMVVW